MPQRLDFSPNLGQFSQPSPPPRTIYPSERISKLVGMAVSYLRPMRISRGLTLRKNGSGMSTSIMDYINVNAKMADLGCVCPTSGLALLPINFAAATSLEELRHAAQTSTVRKLMLQKGLPLCDIVERSQRPPYVKNKSSELVLPILYLSASFLSQNPALVTVALNVVSSYVYESLRHLQRKGEVRFDIVAEDQKRGLYRHISYKGPVDGLESLPDSIREAIK